MKKIPTKDFSHIQAGDTVTRMLGGVVPMKLKVEKVEEGVIHCGPLGWKFSARNGAEIDEDLGWDEVRTGSYLVND